MSKNKKSEIFLLLASIFLIVLLVGNFLYIGKNFFNIGSRSKESNSTFKNEVPEFSKVNYTSNSNEINQEITKLPIPPIIEGTDSFTLIPQESTTEFFEGVETFTRGYNGNILGPTLRLEKGNDYNVTIQNEMTEETTVHWHGLLVDSDVDGVFQVVDENDTLEQTLSINQDASTAWYHPHTMHKTASQVMEGLAGFIIIEDEFSKNLELPSDYGVNDIPIVFQRKNLDNNGQIELNGFRDISLVNGANRPTLEVKNEWIRTRIINGNNDELLRLSFSDNVPMFIIATDNGFTEKPLLEDSILLSPGERVELLLDLTKFEVGNTIDVYNDDINVMKIYINEAVNSDYFYNLPTDLVEHNDEAFHFHEIPKREFELSMRHMRPVINDKSYNVNYIDEQIELGSKEIWTVTNTNNMMSTPHPFHVHGVTFKVLDRNGKAPENWEKGYKDTVLLLPDETVNLLVSFENKGKFVYHCHFLDHEENGMMGNFIVE